ncbi:MAG: UTP--glucose-1-phosphate uridylyltransferase [Thermodesulfobacterium sp.]|jgi:UTP--glucose-1-phosphate uridylyltransferase|nr:UTP--glucose-1-phosphate uridylyltransferase [Thermodesulfobacterium sp.]
MIRKALLPVAGLGTRMLPITKVVPKELLPILNRPAIEYIVQEIIQSGLDTIIFVIFSGKEAIVDYFDINLALRKFLEERNKVELLRLVEEVESKVENLVAVRQKKPEGLGHAVLMGERVIGNEPFAVILGDDLVASDVPCLKQMLSVYLELSAKYEDVSLIALEEVPREDVSKYGIVDGDRVSENIIRMRRVIEKPPLEEAPTNYAIIGRYIFTPKLFEYLKKIPKRGGEYQLTDGIQGLIDDGYPVFGFFFQGMRLDTGNLKGYLKSIVYYALQDPELREVVFEMISK